MKVLLGIFRMPAALEPRCLTSGQPKPGCSETCRRVLNVFVPGALQSKYGDKEAASSDHLVVMLYITFSCLYGAFLVNDIDGGF